MPDWTHAGTVRVSTGVKGGIRLWIRARVVLIVCTRADVVIVSCPMQVHGEEHEYSNPEHRSGHRRSVVAIPRRYNFAEDVLARNLTAGRGNKTAYIDPRGTWSYGQLAERVARFGNLLRGLGIQREQRILICLTDTIDWPTSFLGAVKAGVVAIPVNTLMSEAEYRIILEDSRARLLIVSEELYPRFANLIDSSPDLEHILVSGNQGFGHALFEDALQAAVATDYTAPTIRDEMCFWLYTSGSTGQPKAAVHVHATLRLTAYCYGAHVLGLTENDVVYSVSKLFFAYGLGNAMSSSSFGRCDDGADVGTPDTQLGRGAFANARGYRVLCGADLLHGVSCGGSGGTRGTEASVLPFRRRSASGRYWAVLERTLWRRYT